uniref:DUF1279 domain-containing protein n=1 Tax=Chromera velia CCMP2878 TaxID=1169474 RepID=A0A0G4F446_9ALVE|mmetsp:Transcript_7964/g.15529  ORF Transcript_7964/g.15529 Transcript_7964/m.15529 type:complete len:204 (-) Transcript_7964:412-1023(-)|eukprot:Cvel_15102.t1-p1 / transcript=Cvel_15102.t1 / gene=Cvel_15102 / organism=Chromera_velia_CCMP2878 / gene_product=Protein FAM210B, putative / transcript_product=Protein FAM210B, putative / location=Cvel_scaffold1102:19979-22100(+) / protein_length=203 / sequence_SO=supercontig / SO=protein_coding / is_pseudo=false
MRLLSMQFAVVLALFAVSVAFSPLSSQAFPVRSLSQNPQSDGAGRRRPLLSIPLAAVKTTEDTEEETEGKKSPLSPEEATKKYGLEVGLFKAAKGRDMASAKDLLAKYGGAYLITSIALAIISMGANYWLVDHSFPVAEWLRKLPFNIQVNETGEKASTFAIAYALHKAESPLRFPPTVALTPLVAKALGRKEPENSEGSGEA